MTKEKSKFDSWSSIYMDSKSFSYIMNTCFARPFVSDKETDSWEYVREEEMEIQSWYSVAYSSLLDEKEVFISLQ